MPDTGRSFCYLELHLHVVSEDHSINRDARERVKYIGFTVAVGVLLLLNVTGLFSSILGIDTAIFLTSCLRGMGHFPVRSASCSRRRISADLAICIAGRRPPLPWASIWPPPRRLFIMLVGEGLEAYAAGRTEAAIHKFVEQLPHRARVLRDG